MSSTSPGVKGSNRDKDLTHDPKRLRRRRLAAGLQGIDLAAKTGYSKQHLSGLERGDFGASAKCLAAIAAALKCEITDIMPAEPAEIAS